MATAVTSSIATKKPKPVVKRKRKRKKKGKNYYFNQGTEKAIIRYNKTDDAGLKNIIYNEHIAKAFDKLAENIIHTFKFYYFDVSSEEVKHEVVSFMVMNMHKFKKAVVTEEKPQPSAKMSEKSQDLFDELFGDK